MGSTTKAAVRGPSACSSAGRSPKGTWRTEGTSGSNPWWYFSWPVTVSAKRVRPWKEFTQATISLRSGWPASAWTFRASLSMASLASAPELQKKTRRANEPRTSSSASSTARGV